VLNGGAVHISTADWIVLGLYLAVVGIIGLLAGLQVKDTDHYFLGKRRFGRWLMIGQSFGIGTHAEMPVSLAGAVYTTGFSGIWFHWKNLFATPFYWIMAPVFRRIRRTTLAEMTEDRYGVWMGGVYTVFALCYFTLNTASMLKGAGKVINQAAGGDLGVDRIVIAMTVVFIFYSFVGGLVATAWTDFFQGFLIIALSFMLLPLGWGVVGGLDGMKGSLESYRFSLAAPEGITPWIIFMLTINGLIGIMAQPHMLAAVGTGKDEKTCRIGFFYGNFVKRVCTVGWALVGLMVAALTAQGVFGVSELADPEDAFGFACHHLLFPGALGLLIACVLAANMSTCSAFMVDSGALFTQGFLRRHLIRGRDDRFYLWMGRVSGLAVTLMGVLYALFLIDRVLYSFLLTETLATYMGISVVGGIVWRRANRWGALASLVVSVAVNFGLYAWRGERLDHWDANVFLVSLLAGILAMVLASRLTPPEPRERMESFFGRLESPAEGPQGAVDPSPPDEETRRRVAAEGRQSLLVNLLSPRRGAAGVGFWRAYRDDLGGFLLGWCWAVGLVVVTWLWLRG
jgi:Na+/proline symporter